MCQSIHCSRSSPPMRCAVSKIDLMAMAPPNENVYRLDARPVKSRRSIEKRAPKPFNFLRIKPGRSDRLRIAHGRIDQGAQLASQPPVIGQYEARLWPVKQTGIQTLKSNSTQH